MNKKAFTLIELLIVIVIIGILAAATIPRLFGPPEQARSSEARHMLGVIRGAERAFQAGPAGGFTGQADADIDNCPSTSVSWQGLGLVDPNDADGDGTPDPNLYFNYCVNINNTNGFFVISAQRTGVAAPAGTAGTFMCLNQNGIWSGNYPQTPQNVGPNCAPIDPESQCC